MRQASRAGLFRPASVKCRLLEVAARLLAGVNVVRAARQEQAGRAPDTFADAGRRNNAGHGFAGLDFVLRAL
jgi:hypothetical protein